jgi:hypothetical protein
MTSDRFQGRFGSSNDRFYLTKIVDYYDWTVYMDYYYYYPNNGWYWSPRYAMENGLAELDEQKRIKVKTENEELNEDDNGNQWEPELNETDGIVSYGKRM